jgi:hypothetical protein
MASALEDLQAFNVDMGYVRDISESAAGYDCPVHEVPLLDHVLETFSGWFAVTVCPAHDGHCHYSPDAPPIGIDEPKNEGSGTDKPAAVTPGRSPQIVGLRTS